MRIHSSDNYMMLRGFQETTAFALANWMGYADESAAPYSAGEKNPAGLKAELAYEDTAHLNNAYWAAASDTQEVKSMLMKYGAAALNIGFDESKFNNDTAAYCGSKSSTDHTVTVIGWDDTYSAQNFLPQCRPSSDGAWLAKNSWGNQWGDNGYFWISYEEPTIHLDYSAFYFYDAAPADNYDHNYHYDGSINTTYRYYKQDFQAAAVYQAGAGRTGAEALEAVGIAVYGTDVDYSLQIYQNITDRQNPESGVPVLETPQTGTLPYCGYHTIPLQQAVPLADGCTFSIVISLKKGKNEHIGCYVDNTSENSPMETISCIASQNPGETMLRTMNYAWLDTALVENEPFTLRLKAFTSDIQQTDISSCAVTFPRNLDEYYYDGTEKKPAITVKNQSVMLTEGKDYQVSYKNNVNAGTAYVTIRGIGSYTGTVEKSFQILQLPLSFSMVTLSEDRYVYDGTEKTPKVTVKNKSVMLAEGKDYQVSYRNNVNAGTAYVTIRGIGSCTGTVDISFTVSRQYGLITASDVTRTASAAAQTFALDAGYDGDGRLRYQSSNPAVQTDQNGWVTIDKNFIGSAVITITLESGNYYASGKSVIVTVKPAPVQVTSVKNTAGRSVKVKWKKAANITSYQIQCALDKKFTKSITTYTRDASVSSLKISGLKKGRTYYIRSRAYKYINDQASAADYYSDWGTVKRVKIKK